MKSYETVTKWIVPRSAVQVASDSEYILYAVTTFKKHSNDFIHKCREQKWIPRDFKFKEGGQAEEKKDLERASSEERKLWGEVLRLARTNWGEAVMAWIHVLVLRVFVESVLRYGLPLAFVCGLIKVWIEVLWFSDQIFNINSRLRSKQRKLETSWIPIMVILQAMPLVGIRKVELSKKMLQICKRPAQRITRHTCAMTLR